MTVKHSLYIPMDEAAYSTHGACYTGKTQIKWMGQLAERPGEWQVHVDGKYKLHHGKWCLITLGAHHLRYDVANAWLSNQFVPLVYLMCKEQETNGSMPLLIHAAQATCMKYYQKKLIPGAAGADHCPASRKAIEDEWPNIEFGQCYPHLIRKFGEGEYVSTKWEHFHEAEQMIRDVHFAHTDAMKVLIVEMVGCIWDEWGNEMDAFWDSNMVAPWDGWSVCDMQTMLATPANQV